MVAVAALDRCTTSYSESDPPFKVAPGTTLFCDFDGPIIDVSDRYYATYQLALAKVAASLKTRYPFQNLPITISPLAKSQFWVMKQNRTPDPEIAIRSGLRGDLIDAFLHEVHELVNQTELLDADQVQPGVRWALTLIRNAGVRLVLVTLRDREQAMQVLYQNHLIHFFNEIYGTYDLHIAYENPTELKARLLTEVVVAQQAMGQIPACMVGDTEADILAGQAVGIPTVALTCGIRSQTYLEQLSPTVIYGDLLSAAQHLLVR